MAAALHLLPQLRGRRRASERSEVLLRGDKGSSETSAELLRGKLMDKFGFKVEHEDIYEAAKAYVSYQYAMYGLPQVPEEMMTEAVGNILKDRRQLERLSEQVEDNKVIGKIKETVKFKTTKISSEKFREL